MAATLRIAILLQDLEFGGTQQYAIRLLQHLDRARFAPELWVLRGGSDLAAEAEKNGAPIVRLSAASWVTPAALARLAWRLFRQPPQLLYTLTAVPNIWGRIFGRLARVPVVVSGYRSLLPKQWERLLWRLSDRIICNAEAARETLVRRFSVDPARIAVIPNAVDAERFCPQPATRAPQPTVLFVGRLVADKAPLNMLEGFRLAAERVPEARFEIIGDGPLKPELERRIRSHGLESRVALLPAGADVRAALARAWVFTLPSASEASPNAILEAMAAGLPVVATRVGGIPELVADGATGLLVEPQEPAALANAIAALLNDGSQREEMGRRGRERVLARHDVSHAARKLEGVLLEICDARGL